MPPCTPYPATFPCEAPPMPPVHVDPYRPTLPPADAATVLLPVVPAAPDDELPLDRTSVPEPSVVLLTVIALATLWRARRPAR